MADVLKAGVFPAVVEFERSMTAILFSHIHKPGHWQDPPVLIHIQLDRLISALSEINGAVAGIYSTYPASCKHAEPVHHFMCDKTILARKVW